VEKDSQHNMNQDEEKELDKALSNEALLKIENRLTKAELDKLAAFFAKEMLNNPSQEKPNT
jgi:hypothetical protein